MFYSAPLHLRLGLQFREQLLRNLGKFSGPGNGDDNRWKFWQPNPMHRRARGINLDSAEPFDAVAV
ncbi:MAG: hypothetical protein DME57_09385, partial [Verrucomicrobia bacterium]